MRKLLLGLLVLLMMAAPAEAEDVPGPPSAGGGVGPSTFFVGIIAPGGGGAPGFVSPDDPNGPRPYTYTYVPVGTPGTGICTTGYGTPGAAYAIVVRDLSGAIISSEGACLPISPDGTVDVPDAPEVPTIGEIWRAALRDIDKPVVGINPRPTGLTGLETWLWYEGPSELAISTGIGAWTVTGTAYLREITFDMGDGEPVTATSPGSATDPATRFVYETKGEYEITITARWEADLVLSGPGLPGRPTPIGSAVLRSTETYPVQEVRSLLVG